MTMLKGFPDLPPIWWLASMAVIYGGKSLAPTLHIQTSIQAHLSWLLLALALVMIAWSAIWFWRKRTPIEPHHEPKALIVEGPYRISRNPIYLALVMITLSSAIGHGSLFGLVAAFGLWWILDQRFACVEEALLRQSFGAEAETYFQATRRWL